MTSQKQLEANKINALKGGVKTPDGKLVSSLNAIKHGILSKEVRLPGENGEELLELSKKLRSDLKPVGELEVILVEWVIANIWRFKRALKGEREMIEHDMKDEKSFGAALSYDFANYDSYGKFTRYETSLERGVFKALHELQRLQAVRKGEKPVAPLVVDVDISKD